ncbi:MAG: UDP-N-acetylmuramate dehydrogenase [Rikenellaceae bacterium]|nr:UDP-N-acetylmuramate dehydrogenase [Rikenellaceae bacterium]
MKIFQNFDLKERNTLGLKAIAKYYVEPTSIEELKSLLSDKSYEAVPKMVIGAGSNILFRGDYDGLIIHPSIKDIKILREDVNYIYVRAGAGVVWDKLVEYAVDRGWGGMENLSSIPGCTGAAPVQNIGAYGAEAKEIVFNVEYLCYDGAVEKSLSCEECRFGYRDSIFKRELKGKGVITYVTFRLLKSPSLNTGYEDVKLALKDVADPTISQVRSAISSIRAKKLPDPTVVGNAGSFFKNPVVNKSLALQLKELYQDLKLFPAGENAFKLPAAWLIDKCGFKGTRTGNVGVHANQALVLLAYEGATGEELINLSKTIIETVKERFNVDIEPEVNIC